MPNFFFTITRSDAFSPRGAARVAHVNNKCLWYIMRGPREGVLLGVRTTNELNEYLFNTAI